MCHVHARMRKLPDLSSKKRVPSLPLFSKPPARSPPPPPPHLDLFFYEEGVMRTDRAPCLMLSLIHSESNRLPRPSVLSSLPNSTSIIMAFKAFVVLVALCLVSLASGFVAPTSMARNGE